LERVEKNLSKFSCLGTFYELSPFDNNIFESLTIKLDYPGRSAVTLTSAYRSNGSIPGTGTTPAQQLERFYTKFDELLHNLSPQRTKAFVFMDSNIDLLNLGDGGSQDFLNSILSKGFLQCAFKATRIQNNSKTLIDNILTNGAGKVATGTIISDISDHFSHFSKQPLHQKKERKKLIISDNFLSKILSFDNHISHVCSKISKSLFCINRIKNFLASDSLKKFYFAMVHSHIAYCQNIYGCATQTNLEKKFLKQKTSN